MMSGAVFILFIAGLLGGVLFFSGHRSEIPKTPPEKLAFDFGPGKARARLVEEAISAGAISLEVRQVGAAPQKPVSSPRPPTGAPLAEKATERVKDSSFQMVLKRVVLNPGQGQHQLNDPKIKELKYHFERIERGALVVTFAGDEGKALSFEFSGSAISEVR